MYEENIIVYCLFNFCPQEVQSYPKKKWV